MHRQTLEELYALSVGSPCTDIRPLTPAGSARRYFRLSGPVSLVGVAGTDRLENEAFVMLARHFEECGLPAPRVTAVSDDGMSYLQTDLGDTSLWDLRNDTPLLRRTIATLPEMQTRGIDAVDFGRCYPVARFDARAVRWDLNYFKYSYLRVAGIPINEPKLEDAFDVLCAETDGLLTPQYSGLMLRDFQTRNVMVHEGKPYFIDFQGARLGPLAYDVASFIYQARAQFAPELRDELVECYCSALGRLRPVPPHTDILTRRMALLRTMQVLGAYGLRGLVEGKPHFIASIGYALDNLRHLLATGACAGERLGYLRSLLADVAARQPEMPPEAPADGLTVRVTSFSFRKGYPADPSGNGGGFVFDCRAMDNPGRYERYRPLTGLDRPVITFLEERGQIQDFLTECYALCDEAVSDYLRRGFTSLCVSFGCTGGRHRSVYSAEHMAAHLKERFPQIHVLLNHREQNITRLL